MFYLWAAPKESNPLGVPTTAHLAGRLVTRYICDKLTDSTGTYSGGRDVIVSPWVDIIPSTDKFHCVQLAVLRASISRTEHFETSRDREMRRLNATLPKPHVQKAH